MTTRSADPNARRSLDARPCRPLRTAAGGSSPHSASTSCSAGTTRPTCSARTASSARSFAPATVIVVALVIEHFELAEQPDAHGSTVSERIGHLQWEVSLASAPRRMRDAAWTSTMSAIEHALLAVLAADGGDGATAHGHIARAQQQQSHDRSTGAPGRRDRRTRRRRSTGSRAAGLALEHLVEFPDDAELLGQLLDSPDRP